MSKIEALEKLARRHIEAAQNLTLNNKALFATSHEKEAARIATLIANLPDAETVSEQEHQDTK
jgi:hypothetical protein